MKIQDISNTAEFLATMTRDQLKEYAQKQSDAGNPYLVSLALFVSDQQKAVDRNKQAKAEPQGSVVDTAINNIAPMARASMPAEEVEFDQEMPENTGIGQIPVDDTYYGAEGGIVAFAEPTEDNNYSLVTDPQFGGSPGEIAEDRPRPTREQVNAMVQAMRDRKQSVGLSDIIDIESGKRTVPTNAAAPNVAALPPEVSGDRRAPVATSAVPSAPMSATPSGAALPSSKPMDIPAMFEAEKKKRLVTDSPYKAQLEAIAKSEQEAAKAETAGLEAIQAKYADITKGQRDRQDAKEKAIEAMDNQGLGIGLLLYGAELMSKRRPDAGVAAKGFLANRDKVAEARDKLSESRDRLEAAEAQRGELNATQLNKLRSNERRVGIDAQKVMLKAVMEQYNVNEEMGLKMLDLQIRQGISLYEQDRADRRAATKDKSPAQQIFDRLLVQKGGDPIAAQQEYNRMFADKPEAEYRKALLQKKADIISGPLGSNEMGRAQIAAIDAEIARMGGRQPSNAPSAAAIAALKANPNLAAEFDKKFNGSSAQYLR